MLKDAFKEAVDREAVKPPLDVLNTSKRLDAYFHVK